MYKQTTHCFMVLVISCVCYTASAEEDAALDAYDRGVELFKQEAFRESAASFRKAFELKPTWKIYYNIGQAEASAKRYGLALDAFEAYLVEGGDEIDEVRRESIIKELRSFRYLVGTVEVEAQKGVQLYIDDELRATVPLSSILRVTVGRHRFVLKDGEDILLDKTLRIVGEETTVIRFEDGVDMARDTANGSTAEPSNSANGAAGVEEYAKTKGSKLSNKTLFGIVVGGVGLAVFIGGIPLFATSQNYFDKAEKETDWDIYIKWKDEYERYRNLGIALFVSGGVLLTAGTALLVIGLREQIQASRVGKRFELAPSLTGLSVRF